MLRLPSPPMPADPPSMRPGRAGTTFRLGYLGRLSREKNLGYLLDIVGAMRTPVETHIFGCGPEEAALKQRAAAKGLNIIFHGEVPHEEVPAAIDQCDLFLITSLFEGQCLVALEVLSRARPILSTPVGALCAILRDGRFGRLLPANNVIAAAKIVDEALDSITTHNEYNECDIIRQYKTHCNRNAIISSYRGLLQSSNSATM